VRVGRWVAGGAAVVVDVAVEVVVAGTEMVMDPFSGLEGKRQLA